MRVAEAIVKILEKEGIKAAFGIPGAAINPVYEFLSTSTIAHYIARHEEGAVHAADGYARASGEMALAICTSGPGATNFVTGLYTAQIDSIPLIAITGQNVRAQFGKEAFQCVDIARIAAPVCKATWCVTEPNQVPFIMQQAFRQSHRPGTSQVGIDHMGQFKAHRRLTVDEVPAFEQNFGHTGPHRAEPNQSNLGAFVSHACLTQESKAFAASSRPFPGGRADRCLL